MVGGKLNVRPLAVAFGTDREVAKQASPLTHVQAGLPPFLLLNGGLDYAPLPRMTKEFTAALKKNGCEVQEKEIPWRTHETLLFDVAHLTADRATTQAIQEFIASQAARYSEGRGFPESRGQS